MQFVFALLQKCNKMRAGQISGGAKRHSCFIRVNFVAKMQLLFWDVTFILKRLQDVVDNKICCW